MGGRTRRLRLTVLPHLAPGSTSFLQAPDAREAPVSHHRPRLVCDQVGLGREPELSAAHGDRDWMGRSGAELVLLFTISPRSCASC